MANDETKHETEAESDVNSKSARTAEAKVHQHARHNSIELALINTYSTFIVFVFHLISIESLVAIALSVGMTVYLFETRATKEEFDGLSLDWVLLSFAVITPISSLISLAFNRREQALRSIANIRSTSLELYIAHACWDFGFGKPEGTGRQRSHLNWLEHADAVTDTILCLHNSISRYLALPTSSRARHKVTWSGHQEAAETLAVSKQLYEDTICRLTKLTLLCEVLKREGLPPNEATRLRQWERMILEEIEYLRGIKKYRTPQGLRSFGRLFSVLLPPFYAPFYAELGRSLNSLAVGVIFSCWTSIALTSLFETVSQMEDPFIRSAALDGIRVEHELVTTFESNVLRLRRQFFPDANTYKSKILEADPAESRQHALPGRSSVRLFSE